jgi:hypothetical protein
MSVERNWCERDVISTAASLRTTLKKKHLKLKHVLGGERLPKCQPSKVGSSGEERVAGHAFADEIARIAAWGSTPYISTTLANCLPSCSSGLSGHPGFGSISAEVWTILMVASSKAREYFVRQSNYSENLTYEKKEKRR